MMTNKELLLKLKLATMEKINEDYKIDAEDMEAIFSDFMRHLEFEPVPVKKFIFVEDGSVDADELTEMLSATNPEIKVIVYRQGGREPSLVEVDKKDG